MSINIDSKEYKIVETKLGTLGNMLKLEKDNKYYVLKKISIADLTNEEIELNKEKYKILSKINNEYIVKYYHYYIENDYLNILMEYVGYSNLKNFIKNHKEQEELIEENIIENIIRQICIGLKDIHKNEIIHRDLTPDNIFINEYNEIKIGDFGISKRLETLKMSAHTQIGKLHYIAPEMQLGQSYNNKVDIYALGCIIYELFTLNEYYLDKYIAEKDCKINNEIYNNKWQKLIDSLLEKDYKKRPNIKEIYDYIKNEIMLSYKFKINVYDIYKKPYLQDETIYEHIKNKIVLIHKFNNNV